MARELLALRPEVRTERATQHRDLSLVALPARLLGLKLDGENAAFARSFEADVLLSERAVTSTKRRRRARSALARTFDERTMNG